MLSSPLPSSSSYSAKQPVSPRSSDENMYRMKTAAGGVAFPPGFSDISDYAGENNSVPYSRHTHTHYDSTPPQHSSSSSSHSPSPHSSPSSFLSHPPTHSPTHSPPYSPSYSPVSLSWATQAAQELENERASMQATLARSRREWQAARAAQEAEWKTRIAQLRAEHTRDTESRERVWEDTLEHSKAEQARLERQIDSLNSLLGSERAKSEKARTQFDEEKQRMWNMLQVEDERKKINTRRIEQLQQSLDSAKAENDRARTEKRSLEGQVQQLTSKAEALTGYVDSQRKEIEELQRQNDILKAQLDKQKEENSNLRRFANDSSNKQHALEFHMQQLEEKNDTLTLQIKRLTELVRSMESSSRMVSRTTPSFSNVYSFPSSVNSSNPLPNIQGPPVSSFVQHPQQLPFGYDQASSYSHSPSTVSSNYTNQSVPVARLPNQQPLQSYSQEHQLSSQNVQRKPWFPERDMLPPKQDVLTNNSLQQAPSRSQSSQIPSTRKDSSPYRSPDSSNRFAQSSAPKRGTNTYSAPKNILIERLTQKQQEFEVANGELCRFPTNPPINVSRVEYRRRREALEEKVNFLQKEIGALKLQIRQSNQDRGNG